MNSWVIVPVKGFSQAKNRLADMLSPEQRKQLCECMLKDVLTAITSCPEVSQVLVITNDSLVKTLAKDYHVDTFEEPDNCKGLNDAVRLGVDYAESRGADRVLILHADIPLTQKEDISHLLRAHLEGTVTLVPDKYDKGTNGLICDLPFEFDFLYGENSFNKHLNAIRDRGFIVSIAKLPDLVLDIDQYEDLLLLAESVERNPSLLTSQLLQNYDWVKLLEPGGRELSA